MNTRRNIFLNLVTIVLLICVQLSFVRAQNVHRHPHLENYNFQLLPSYDNSSYEVTRYDFWVTLRDGIKLDGLKFIPNGTPPSGGWPTVIMVHGYGDNKETLAGFCQAQAQYGYYTMTFSVRGQGHSEGLSNLISTTEMLDMIEMINYVKHDSAAGSNPNNILIMGGSQGGVLPFRAACNGGNVRTIISALAPPNFASSWIENGCIKMTFLWTIEYTPDTARYTPLVDRMSDWVYANNKAKWDSLAYWLPIGRDFMSEVHNCNVPMLIEGSWQDKFFNADGIIQSLNSLSVPYISYIGAVRGHGGDPSTTEDQWHMQLFNDWFFYWLYNMPNGILNIPKYQYASTTYPYTSFVWSFVHDSTRTPYGQLTSNLRLYFNKNNKLKTTPNNGNHKEKLKNQVSGGLTMEEAVNEAFTGSDFNSKFRKESMNFQTDPLLTDMKWVGTPAIKLDYSSNANTFCQYNFQIYEVKPNGQAHFVDRLNYTDRSYVRHSRRQVVFKGQAHSHIFKAGDRIRVVLTNLDTAPADTSFLATNPFVLPVLENANNEMYLTADSYIELPLLGGDNSLSMLPPDDEPEYQLKQNYPNPFNPVTTVEYYLAVSGKVSINVYDLLGREVRTLVNEPQREGTHQVEFNAANLASGIYFCRLSVSDDKNAQIFQEVKRLILVK
jgi:predicted acyl esterase